MNREYTFRNMDGLSNALRILLWLSFVMAVLSLISAAMQAELLGRGRYTMEEARANDLRERIISFSHVGLYLITAIVFGCWIVRANKNVRSFGASDLPITPGWALGYFFVPFINLWRPYQAMRDLWRASRNPAAWQTVAPNTVLPLWWILWLTMNMIGQMSFHLSLEAKHLSEIEAATYVRMIGEAVWIPLCLVAILLVTQILKAQRSLFEASAIQPATDVASAYPY
jgi:hypothetical protein